MWSFLFFLVDIFIELKSHIQKSAQVLSVQLDIHQVNAPM